MRNRWIVGLALAGVLVGTATPAWASSANDTAIDRVGDWLATVGKSGTEKDAAIAQRKATRTAKRAEEMARKQAKAAGNALKSLTN